MIFDEAHELEEVASSYFGLSVSNIRFEELARDTDVLLRGKEGADKLPAVTQQLRERARMFFAGLPMAGDGRQPFTGREEFLETSGDLYMAVRATLRRLEAEMEALKGVDEAPGLRKRVARLRTELEFLLESNASNMVYWMERRVVRRRSDNVRPRARGFTPQSRTTFLQATPIDVSELLHELVFDQIPTVVLTSATLTVQGGFEHMRKRLGLDRSARAGGALALPLRRAGAALSAARRCPTRASRSFPRPPRDCIRRVLEITRGRAFCLFTSYAQMRDLYERLLPVLDFPTPAARHRAAQGAAGGVSRHAQRRALRHIELLAGRGRAGRSAELRHHRPAALRRAQRPGGAGAHEGH